MIIQACLNGSRPVGFHPSLPLSSEALARDAAACVAAGAAELHMHPRDEAGRETLAPPIVDQAVLTVRRSCPGRLVGISTGAWIERSTARTLACIETWRECPDYASVNLSEPDAPSVIAALWRRSIGVEAGLASAADAERLLSLGYADRALRVLIEIDGQNDTAALYAADDIDAVLTTAGCRRPRLLHGHDTTVWSLVARARDRRFSTRVGLEDGDRLPDGRIASANADLVAAAAALIGSR